MAFTGLRWCSCRISRLSVYLMRLYRDQTKRRFVPFVCVCTFQTDVHTWFSSFKANFSLQLSLCGRTCHFGMEFFPRNEYFTESNEKTCDWNRQPTMNVPKEWQCVAGLRRCHRQAMWLVSYELRSSCLDPKWSTILMFIVQKCSPVNVLVLSHNQMHVIN